jgi:hypothetical protein
MIRALALFLALVCLAGCGGAPVQEMSDARQAIAAARVAGAPERAPADFDAAQGAITRAETHLQAQEYTRARIAALEAKRHAAVALSNAEKAGPPPTPLAPSAAPVH